MRSKIAATMPILVPDHLDVKLQLFDVALSLLSQHMVSSGSFVRHPPQSPIGLSRPEGENRSANYLKAPESMSPTRTDILKSLLAVGGFVPYVFCAVANCIPVLLRCVPALVFDVDIWHNSTEKNRNVRGQEPI
jgi:hypothetical protein